MKQSDEYQTPDWLFEQLNDRFRFTIDAACTKENCKVRTWCHERDDDLFMMKDGLTESWNKFRVFCNPPYSNKKEWINKAKYEVHNGCPVCVMILPCTMEVLREVKGYHYDILNKRVSFIDPITGKPAKGNNTGTVIIYFWGEIYENRTIL